MSFWGKRLFAISFGVWLCAFAFASVFAAVRISETQIRELARDLAPKVNLFKVVWDQDPDAIFFAGTSRDFLYWILREAGSADTPEQLEAKMAFLRGREVIDIKEIVGSESDIDLISERIDYFDAAQFGVRKSDLIDPKRFDRSTEAGRNEIEQGFLPTEKIALSKTEIRTMDGFGDGLKEILSGDLSFHPTDESVFWNSPMAKQGLNHPVFLAIRYLRLRAAHWHNTRGSGLPDRAELMNFPEEIKQQIRDIFLSAQRDPRFEAIMRNPRALGYLNSPIVKAFRAYTNPTAAFILFSELGFKELQARFPKMESINQFLFAQYRDPKAIAKNFRKYANEMKPQDVYVPVKKFLPDFKLLHGTKKEPDFRAIIFQNVYPSEGGSAGEGLYAVDSSQVKFAEDWGGSIDRVVEFEISEDAKVIDISEGPGQSLWQKWKRETGGDYDDFAKAFGADVLRYNYTPKAFVVKNSKVLINRQGLTRKLMTIGEALKIAEAAKTPQEIEACLNLIMFNAFSDSELSEVLNALPDGAINPEVISKLDPLAPRVGRLIGALSAHIPESKFFEKVEGRLLELDRLRKGSDKDFEKEFVRELISSPELTSDHHTRLVEMLCRYRLGTKWLLPAVSATDWTKKGGFKARMQFSEKAVQSIVEAVEKENAMAPLLVGLFDSLSILKSHRHSNVKAIEGAMLAWLARRLAEWKTNEFPYGITFIEPEALRKRLIFQNYIFTPEAVEYILHGFLTKRFDFNIEVERYLGAFKGNPEVTRSVAEALIIHGLKEGRFHEMIEHLIQFFLGSGVIIKDEPTLRYLALIPLIPAFPDQSRQSFYESLVRREKLTTEGMQRMAISLLEVLVTQFRFNNHEFVSPEDRRVFLDLVSQFLRANFSSDKIREKVARILKQNPDLLIAAEERFFKARLRRKFGIPLSFDAVGAKRRVLDPNAFIISKAFLDHPRFVHAQKRFKGECRSLLGWLGDRASPKFARLAK